MPPHFDLFSCLGDELFKNPRGFNRCIKPNKMLQSLLQGLWFLQKRPNQFIPLWCSPARPSPQQVRVQVLPSQLLMPLTSLEASSGPLGGLGARKLHHKGL